MRDGVGCDRRGEVGTVQDRSLRNGAIGKAGDEGRGGGGAAVVDVFENAMARIW
jgi:hypothetical protein